VDNLLSATLAMFFPKEYDYNIMEEIACEPLVTCDRNMRCYKGFLSWWLAYTAQMVPYTYSQIIPKLQTSATAAAKTCTGGSDGNGCGISWVLQKNVGTTGMEEDMSVLGVLTANLIAFANHKVPLSLSTGGTSQSDPTAGESDPSASYNAAAIAPITTGDRVGAGILTALFIGGWIAGTIWMTRD
jgi:mannan endo-1,6-alpha-mannosidase